ncbi:phosphatase PAP2 family protein [Stackebrandtia soli]|uniref:phosphatase PAP2 family protein n=1 Tax=Stackebrandtia soli TaxID=1892856 RepID=UPI0039E75CCC
MDMSLARLVTHLFAPATVLVVLCLGVGWHADPGLTGLGWGALVAVMCAGIPMAVIVWAMRRGDVTDVHIHHRSQRIVPLSIGVVSVLAGVALTYGLAAPPSVSSLAVALLASIATNTLITLMWKISFHTGVAAATVTILALAYGLDWWTAPAIAVVVLIGWSRVSLRDHTIAQVIVGALWGAIVAGVPFELLR